MIEESVAKLSTRSKVYKEEVRDLKEKIVTIQVKIMKTPELYIKEVVAFIKLYK